MEENVEETGETNELEEALSESAEMTEGDFSYVIVNNSYARITRYSGSATSVQVPSTIGGYAVQVIGARAFQGNTVLESVELPDGLTTIYAYAFENCTSITSIHLPDSITGVRYPIIDKIHLFFGKKVKSELRNSTIVTCEKLICFR